MQINKKTLDFIEANKEGDVRQLAFKRVEGVDMAFALDQIAGRQTARRKLPTWAAVEGMVYPAHLSMEQCSSEAAARYKARLARKLTGEGGAGRMADLTGGFGVDFSFMAREFGEATYVERQERLCDIARHNLSLLGLADATVVCADGTDYLHKASHHTLLYMDPARRDATGGRTYAISDCTPDVCALREELLAKADVVMVKLSPMLDWRKAVADLGGKVAEVHVVSVGGECKELLLVLRPDAERVERICCVNDGELFESVPRSMGMSATQGIPTMPQAPCYLYEPNASIMKAGCFAEVEAAFGVGQLARDSHLFVSKERVEGFPGRTFRVEAVTSMNKKELRRALAGVARANIATRNFPVGVAELRKRLKLGEGGGTYIFATTLADGSHVLLVCSK